MSQPLLVGLLAGVGAAGAVVGPKVMRGVRLLRAHGSGSVVGSIGRVIAWSGESGQVELLSGPRRGQLMDAHCDTPTLQGEHVVVVESSTTGWVVIHLDDADDAHHGGRTTV